MKTRILILVALVFIFEACSRSLTPYDASVKNYKKARNLR
jgi:PBP1b-binding outer membrane lipoprotein LpoB